jgi:hypothetical protein
MCESIAKLRRKLVNISKHKTLFLDETSLRLNEAPTSTLVAPGETEYVIVDDNSAYSKRFDMIACCSGSQVFPPIIYTPDERKLIGAKGINKKMLIKYVQDILGQAVGVTDEYPVYLVLDKTSIHNEQELLDTFHLNGAQNVVHVLKMPTQSAKRMSPLDNSMFHQWKEHCRNRTKITMKNIEQIMSDEWNKFTKEQIYSHYHHCGLTSSTDPYHDCPLPSEHKHNM